MFFLNKTFLVALSSFCSVLGYAQGAKEIQSDTLLIHQFKSQGIVSLQAPFMSDSIDIQGNKYSSTPNLSKYATLLPSSDRKSVATITANPKGFITSTISSRPSVGQTAITSYTTQIISKGYEKGQLLIESSVPFRAFFDHKLISQSDKSTPIDSLRQPYSSSITLSPSRHELVIRTIQTSKDSIPPTLRVRYVSKVGSSVSVTIDDTKYIDLDYMLHGDNLAKVSVSPSGRYTILSKRIYADGKHLTEYILYKGSKKIRTLGTIGAASWIPGADRLYFTRESQGRRSLYSIDPETEQESLICRAIPKGKFELSPSGKYLLYFDPQDGPKAGKHVTRLLGRGDREPSFRQRVLLSLFDLRTGLHSPLTYGFRTTALQSIAPDDSKIIFSLTKPSTQRPFYTSDFIELDLATMKADTLFKEDADISEIWYTSKPDHLILKGSADALGGIGRNLPKDRISNSYDNQLYLYNKVTRQGSPLTKDFAPAVGSVKIPARAFSAYFTAEDRDRVSLYRCDLASGKLTKLSHKEDVVRSFSVSDSGKDIAYIGQSVSSSDRMYHITSPSGKEQLIYDLSAIKIKGYEIGDVKDWHFTMPNGDVVPGRYYLPPHFDPKKKYPLIVYYYGGTAPTSRTFEGAYAPHLYAAQDYVVYILNPSGTTGYGQEYASRHVNAWGQRTADEIVASVKGFCAAHPFINDKKIGCMGASYGGFMTQYLQTITDIFAAAISHAGISALSSYWGEGLWGIGYSTVASADSYPWNNPELYTRQSPLFNADKINTPLLLLHGTVDTNVPDGESVQMYNALKILGKEVEFIRIHDQDHFILDEPKRIEWTHSIFAWFAKWLKDDPTWWDDMYPKTNL